ncbi:hypothetical protein Fmac_009271 [Flemingia macrophylla]|uniref:Uncharacterized protein n=1 Tax=Flemingia macrophylla TaxID=520843 RepID=A0ABD1MZS1_9FABA
MMEAETKARNCNSPEFEFWMLRNPSFPQPNLLSADELFVDGVLLPLHLLHKPTTVQPPIHQPSPPITEPSAAAASSSASKRWKDIFRKGDKKNTEEKPKKKERKTGSSAELNINLWPFSRSRSAGNAATRPKLFAGPPRKVNSAPCSRSNSAGESKFRKWPASPARPGVHVGRTSPVWQVRRGKNSDKPRRSKGGGAAAARVLNLNVPMCIGYRNHLGCRSDENSAAAAGGGGGGNGGNIFNLRNLFAKKCVVTTSH